MNTEHIRANVAITLVGAGRVEADALALARRFAPRVYAADGGALTLERHGLRPEAIIGDLDSLGDPAPWRARGIEVIGIAEQDSTDFAKCLTRIAAPLYLALGFTGDRLDHMLAALSVMAAMPQRRVILLADGDICFLAPLHTELELAAGTRVSLWPIESTQVTACAGLCWDAAGLVLSPRGRIGTSNRALGGEVTLGFDRRTVFMVLPMSELGQAVALLEG